MTTQGTTGGRAVAIACQGGGAHTAFTAGVLARLLEEPELDVRALSGTSGGAVCAVLAWADLVEAAKDQRGAGHRLTEFWADNAVPLWQVLPQAWGLAAMRMLGALGIEPETSGYNLPMDGHRMFLDLLERHVPFDRLTPDRLTDADPRLLISAADVLSGEFRVFSSHLVRKQGPDRIESRTILASAALPTLFRAVPIEGGFFWDGGFSRNPPVRDLVDAARRPGDGADATGSEALEIWVIQVNPQTRDTVPTAIDDIRDRRNELLENMSYQQEIFFISKINDFVHAQPPLLTADGLAKYSPVKVRGITIAHDVADRLDYESKIDRSPAFLEGLIGHGRQRADEFLTALAGPHADTSTTLPRYDVWGHWR